MRKSRYSEEQIAMALRHVEAGAPVAEVCRKVQVAESTFFRWKKVYGGLAIAELRRLKQLEAENRKLKQLVADLSLDKTILQEALQRKWWRRPRAALWSPGPRRRTASASSERVERCRRRARACATGALNPLGIRCGAGCESWLQCG